MKIHHRRLRIITGFWCLDHFRPTSNGDRLCISIISSLWQICYNDIQFIALYHLHYICIISWFHHIIMTCNDSIWVCLKIVYPIVPMVLLIIIPFKWLFHWESTQHFQTNPYVDIVDGWFIPKKSALRKSPWRNEPSAEPSRLLPHPPILIPSMTGWWMSLPLWKISYASVGMMTFPINDGKVIKAMFQSPPTRWVGLQPTDPVGGVKHHLHESAEIHWFSRQSHIRPLPPSNPLRTLNQLNHGEKRRAVSAPVRAEPPSSGKCTDGLSTHFNTFQYNSSHRL